MIRIVTIIIYQTNLAELAERSEQLQALELRHDFPKEGTVPLRMLSVAYYSGSCSVVCVYWAVTKKSHVGSEAVSMAYSAS